MENIFTESIKVVLKKHFGKNADDIYDEGYKDGYLTAVYNIEEELKKEAEQEQSNY